MSNNIWEPGYVAPDTDNNLLAQVTGQAPPAQPVEAPPPAPVSFQEAAIKGAEQALQAALPDIEARLTAKLAAELEAAVIKFGTAQPQPPTLQDLTKKDARSRAVRTLLGGLGLAVLAGIVTVLGQLSHVDWFHKEGWNSVVTLLAASVGTSVLAYFARMVSTPQPFNDALNAPPGTKEA